MDGLFHIRALKKSDLEQLVSLYSQFWGDVSNLDKMASKFDELAESSRHIVLCAEHEGKVVGTIMGVVCDEFYGDCKPFMVMENLVTDSNYRKKGVAKALLQELESISKLHECTQIIFITERDREDAISFYEAMGYNSQTHVGFKKSLE